MSQRWVEVTHSASEIVLGLILAIGTGTLFRLAALGALGMCAAYLVLVGSAVRRNTTAQCNCFGGLGSERVTRMTVWRNAWLLALALGTVAIAWYGHSVREWVVDDGGWQTVAGAAVATITLWLVLPHPNSRSGATDVTAGRTAGSESPEDYVRCRTPVVPVLLGDSTETTLREVSNQRAQLILAVSAGCVSCTETMQEVPRWRTALPQIEIRLLLADAPQESPFTSAAEPQTLHDVHGYVRDSLGLFGTPAAVLLGMDGALAGGPVIGSGAVAEFVSDIEYELGQASTT